MFSEGELERASVVAEFATTAADGKTYQVEHFNLDVIISVGYQVKSRQGTQFRIWATERLREYLVKGFAMDDERLKNLGGSSYWKELLERIIEQERLNPEAARAFMDNAFRDGAIVATGTAITNILPPVSRFSKDNAHAAKKQKVLERLGAFFERYFGLASS